MSNSNTTLEYIVELVTRSLDPEGVPCDSHSLSIQWDEGVDQDWDSWLEAFNSLESEPYEIAEIIPLWVNVSKEEAALIF
jgi:hypothetical protein